LNTAIVILNWNGQHLLQKYLPSVEAFSQLPNVEIIVADNASTDSSVLWLQTACPRIRIISLDRNYGFAEGYNRALQQVEADYYVLLNTDVEVTEGWLQPMFQMMQQKPEMAACMPKILADANHSRFEYAGAAGGYIDKYGYVFCRGRLFHSVESDNSQYETDAEVFWATGACCMIRAKLFHAAGGFDSNFFAHMEEIDLCWRLKKAGYSIWCTPRSAVYHAGGGMLPQSSPFKTYLNYRNNLLMMYKNLPKRHRKRILCLRMGLDIISSIHSLLKGDISVLKAVWKAHCHYRKLRRTCRLPADAGEAVSRPLPCVYQGSAVFQYFILGRHKFDNLCNHFSGQPS
jgi:GT2 family glycosyltransferase